ncbi:MAG: tetratricopeptide repeat protein [Candidatus Binataceae bacterium]
MAKLLPCMALVLAVAVTGPIAAQDFNRASALINDAAVELDRGHFSEGLKLAEEALRSGAVSADNYAGLYNNLCIGLTGLERFNEALDYCNRALALSPRAWAFYNNRANIYFHQGQYDRALAEYYKAMTFSDGTSILMKNINLTLRKRGVPGAVTTAPEKSS